MVKAAIEQEKSELATTSECEQAQPMVKMQVERLADLNIPRQGHLVFCVNGEVVAAGGHTTNFVPTQTAEYYRDGEWHLMQMAYPHDRGVAAFTTLPHTASRAMAV